MLICNLTLTFFFFGLCLDLGSMLLVRVIAVTFCVTLAASLAARQGSTSMAAFQVCLQIWLATSLLADGLAVAGQVRYLFLSTSIMPTIGYYHLSIFVYKGLCSMWQGTETFMK